MWCEKKRTCRPRRSRRNKLRLRRLRAVIGLHAVCALHSTLYYKCQCTMAAGAWTSLLENERKGGFPLPRGPPAPPTVRPWKDLGTLCAEMAGPVPIRRGGTTIVGVGFRQWLWELEGPPIVRAGAVDVGVGAATWRAFCYENVFALTTRANQVLFLVRPW